MADITQVTSATDTTASDRKQDEKQDESAWIYKFGGDSIASTGKMGAVEEQALIDLRGILKRRVYILSIERHHAEFVGSSTPSVSEVFAKTSSSHFVLAKQKIEKELYAVCETKEASLTDAERKDDCLATIVPKANVDACNRFLEKVAQITSGDQDVEITL